MAAHVNSGWRAERKVTGADTPLGGDWREKGKDNAMVSEDALLFWCDYQRMKGQEEKESAEMEEEMVKEKEKNNNNIIVIVTIYWALTRCQEHF